MSNKKPKPTSVEDTETPISHERISQISSDQWEKLSVYQLHNQLLALERRHQYMMESGHTQIATQLEKGIAQIKQVINQKEQPEKPPKERND